MNIRFDDSILQDFGDLCSTFFSSTPMFSIEPDFIKDAVYQQLIAQGIGTSVEEIDAFMESIGYTMDQFIQETFGALDFASLISEDGLPSSNVYKIEDGKLYMEDSVEEYQEGNYAEFTINASTLTFTEIYEDGKPTEEMREILPLVFDRVG